MNAPNIYDTMNDVRTQALGSDQVFSDVTNMRRLIELHGQWLRYDTSSKSWLVWDDTRWKKDDRIKIEWLAKSTIRDMYREASQEIEDVRRIKLAGHAHKSESLAKIKAMVEMCKSEEGIAITSNHLDQNDMLLNCANCTIDLNVSHWEDGYPAYHQHEPEDLITKCMPVNFDPTAEFPTWSRFLYEIMGGSQDLVLFLQRAIAYSLLGSNPHRLLFFLWGSGSNGKSTFINTISHLFGDYAKNAQPETFMRKSGDSVRDDLARLRGARMVTANETDEGQRMAENLVKQLTGGDKMTARHLYGEQFEFTPGFKLWMAGNHKPDIRGSDYGIWSRIMLIPFNVRFEGKQKDTTLGKKLEAEMSGILNWALDGLRYIEGGIYPPTEVMDATRAYRDEMDHLGTYMKERTKEVIGSSCLIGDMYIDYEQWCEANGERAMSKRDLTRKMQERGFRKSKRKGWEWINLTLLGDVEK